MNIDYIAIGQRIRIRRKEIGITQQKLAEMADLSDTNISHIERGATKLSLPSLVAIANALETTPDSLLMDSVDKSEPMIKAEFARLFENCTKQEYKMLYDICKAALDSTRS